MIKWFKKWYNYLKHPNACCMSENQDRKLFVVGRLAFVKCRGCGGESIPWQIKKETAESWLESNPNWAAELEALKRNVEK